MGDIAIKISDVHLAFGKNRVLRGVSGQIKKGSIVTFLGRNGCGKSTLLKIVTGNLKPYMGRAPLLEASFLPRVRQRSTKELPALYQSRKPKVQKCHSPKMR